MKNMTKVAAFISLTTVCATSMAADWNVTQDANITVAAPSLTQGPTLNVTNSNQAINGIVLDTTNDDLATGSQTADLASSTGVILTQGPAVDNANQAINYIAGANIGSTSAITQTVNQTAVSTTLLTQTDTSGTGANLQAANATEATADVDALIQDYNESGALTLIQSTVTTANNTQGVNYASGVNVGTTSLAQTVDVDGITTFTQGAGNVGGSNTQVGNGAVATTGDIDNTTQGFTATTTDLNLTQTAAGVGSNTQATNYMRTSATGDIGGTATTQTTTVTAGAANFLQDAASTNNVQAGNLASSGNDITDLTQTVTAGGASEVDFDQTATTGNSNTQAGNMAEIYTGASGDIVDEISQVFTSSTTVTDFDQVSASTNLIQAGNLIDITSGTIDDSGTTQQFDALGGSVTMDQTGGGSANLQALNAIVDDAGVGSGGTVSQILTITAATFTMNQDNMTGSGQYGNFVGVKY